MAHEKGIEGREGIEQHVADDDEVRYVRHGDAERAEALRRQHPAQMAHVRPGSAYACGVEIEVDPESRARPDGDEVEKRLEAALAGDEVEAGEVVHLLEEGYPRSWRERIRGEPCEFRQSHSGILW